MTTKDDLIARLNPLLVAAEAAIKARDADRARALGFEALLLVKSYADQLDESELRECLNNPVANAIYARLKGQIH